MATDIPECRATAAGIECVTVSGVIDEVAFYFRGHCLLRHTQPKDMVSSGKMIRMVAPTIKQLLHMLYETARCRIRMDIFRASRFARNIIGKPISDQKPLRFFIPFLFCEPYGWWYSLAPFQIDMERSAVAAKINIAIEIGPITQAFNGQPTGQIILSYRELAGGRYTIRLAHDNPPDDKVAEMKKRGYSKRP